MQLQAKTFYIGVEKPILLGRIQTEGMVMKLLDKLREAEEGSRELDAHVAAYITVGARFDKPGHIYIPGCGSESSRTISAPHYTTSIDDALTLIPEGWKNNGLLTWPGRKDGKLLGKCRCTLQHELSSGGGPRVDSYGPTIPLVICIAALECES